MYLDGFLARGIYSIRKLRKLLVKEESVLEGMGLRRAHSRIISRIVRGKKNLEEILLNESSDGVNVWKLCEEPPLFADDSNTTAMKRQTESLKRLKEYLEKQRLLDLELKEVARTQRMIQEKTLTQLARMGFSRDSCEEALNAAGPDVETAAAYLVSNIATLTSPYTISNKIQSDKNTLEKNHEQNVVVADNESSWRCSRCTFLNEAFHKRCAICSMSSTRRAFDEEDEGNEIATNWICGVCRFQNSAGASVRCVFCNASRKLYHEDITTTMMTTTTMGEGKVDVMIEDQELPDDDDDDDDETKEDTNRKVLTLRCPEVVSTLSMCCDRVECLERRKISCPRRLDCGHLCGGIRGEFAPSNSKSRIVGDVVDAGFDMNLSSGNLEISNKGLHVSALPGNGSKLAVLNRAFDWGIVVWKMVRDEKESNSHIYLTSVRKKNHMSQQQQTLKQTFTLSLGTCTIKKRDSDASRLCLDART